MEEEPEVEALEGLCRFQVMVPVVQDLDGVRVLPEFFEGRREGEIMEAETGDPEHGEMICHGEDKGYGLNRADRYRERKGKGVSGYKGVSVGSGKPRIVGVREDTCRCFSYIRGVTIQVVLCE